MSARPDVWYAAYGSNLARVGIASYLEGGAPPGVTRPRPGARDPRPPRAAGALEVGGQVYFAGESTVWGGGGVAFFDHRHDTGRARVRAWLLAAEQFDDVVAQENGRDPRRDPPPAIDVEAIADTDDHRADGWYGHVVVLGEHEGRPVVTCTNGDRHARHAAPGVAYLRIVSRGLLEGWGDDVEGVVAYLAALPGVDGGWRRSDLLALVEGISDAARSPRARSRRS